MDGIPTAEDAYLHNKPPLPVFDMLPYRIVRFVGGWSFLYPILTTFFICQLLYSVQLTLSVEKKFLSPPTLEIKLWILTMVRVCIRFLAPLISTHRILAYQIANVTKELSHHKLLYTLAGHPKYLLILHKEHALKGEQAALENNRPTNIIQHTLDTLYCPLKWSTLAVTVFSIFISLFLYKADGLNYEHLLHRNLTSTNDTTCNIWEGFSIFTALIVVGITYTFFIYEQRLIHYANTLVSKGDSWEVKEDAKDMQQKLAERWKWVEICSIPATMFLTVMVFIQYALGTPLTASCMPFSADFTPTQWLCCISCLVIPSVLTFMNVENWLRVGKRAVCIICLLVLIAHTSWLQSFAGSKSHLHILLYLVPLIILFWISWTFFCSHFTTSKHQGGKSSKHVVLNAFMAAIALCTICLSVFSEYSYIHNSRTQLHPNETCKHLLLQPISKATASNLNFTEDDCQSIAPPETEVHKTVNPIAISPALPPYCHFYGGVYQYRLQRLVLNRHFIQADLSYQVISYHMPQVIHVKCMCPQSGRFSVIFYSSKPIYLRATHQCSNDFRLLYRQSWRVVFSLIANMCIGPRPI